MDKMIIDRIKKEYEEAKANELKITNEDNEANYYALAWYYEIKERLLQAVHEGSEEEKRSIINLFWHYAPNNVITSVYNKIMDGEGLNEMEILDDTLNDMYKEAKYEEV